MKKLKILVFSLVLSVCFLNVKAINADEIRNYDITMNVEESGLIHINQKLKVEFSGSRHGIYANIPQSYFMDFGNGTTYYFFPIKNVSVKNHMYEVEKEIDGTSIKIGDPDSYVNGIVDYEYTYDIQTRDLKLAEKDMLYFNLVGDKWEMDIDKVNFTINMPKSFNQKPDFYPPANSDTKVAYKVNDNSITGSYSDDMTYGDALTIKLDLDKGYFNYPATDNFQMGFVMVSGVLTLLIILLFFRYGRDEKLVKTVEFKAPEGMSSGQVGYVVDGVLHNKDITSLFIYWASKGYLAIKELEDDKFEFIKLKDIPDDEFNIERNIFNALFKKKTNVQSDDIPEAYQEATLNAMADYGDYYKKDNAIFVKKSNVVKFLSGLVIYLLIAINIAVHSYEFFEMIFPAIISFVIFFIGFLIAGLLFSSALTNRASKSKSKNFGMTLASIIVLVIFAILYLIWSYIINANLVMMLAIIILSYIDVIFIAFMSKRTKKGQRWLGQILGLKDFISMAEKDRLEMFVEENPNYFYDILPYAYVLNVSDKWIKKFEDIKIEQPDWYYSSTSMTNIIFLSTLNHSLNTLNHSVTNIPSAESGSGGFSSGGGGFSGGGFGGGGGGSW